MKQQFFEQQHEKLWAELEAILNVLESARKKNNKDDKHERIAELKALPVLYRRICNHYALAKQRYYSSYLIGYLHDIILRCHQQLYRRKGLWLWSMLEFVWSVFPNAVRRQAGIFWFATLLFYLPAVTLGVLCYKDSDFIYSVMSDGQVAQMEYMYDPTNRKVGRSSDRTADSNFKMFGFYIYHNISIGFRTYASGILLGVGTIFALLFNGVVLGGVAGHLTQLEFTETFWPFVSGHGSFELTAIIICGMAGLVLAKALFAPGQLSRIDALKYAGRESIVLVMGAALMLVVAAFIEAFWSPLASVSNITKYSVAAVLWFIVIAYLGFAGRCYSAD